MNLPALVRSSQQDVYMSLMILGVQSIVASDLPTVRLYTVVISSMVKYLSCYPGVVSLVSGFSGLSDET